MKKLSAVSTFILMVSFAFGQKITGTWYGQLNVQGSNLPLVFHITQTTTGFTSTMDSPNQMAMGLQADTTIFNGNLLSIDIAKYKIKYTGTYLPDSSKIRGRFFQGTVELPLDLSNQPVVKATPAIRPQDPTDFPYKREEVLFDNLKSGIKLAGTLTMPQNGQVSKGVVLITGSGPQNRNEEIVQFNHRPFLVWSDWLTRNGIAVLRYDNRGVGQSTGVFAKATTADFADDAEAAVTYIQSRADCKGLSIGLVGHSEGGMIAPMVASRNMTVKFLVMLAGPGDGSFPLDTVVEWRLEPQVHGTKLFLQQSGFKEINLDIFNSMTERWQKLLQKLSEQFKTVHNGHPETRCIPGNR